jgi:peroxiredoxin family protein
MMIAQPLTSSTEHVETLEAKIAALEARLARVEQEMPEDSLSIIVSSNDFDKLMPAFILATGAASMDMKAHLFFTFWGTAALKKKTIYEGKSFMEKMMTFMMPSTIDSVGLSKMNMMGMGPAMFKMLMAKHNITSLPELVQLSMDLKVRMCACEMTMGLMGITREEMMDGLEYGGVATYLECASKAKITLFL